MAASKPTGRVWVFGPFHLDESERRLLREGQPVQITPRVFDTLIALIEQNGQLVKKEELMEKLWPNTFVEEGALTRNISDLRKALGDGKYVETVPRQGYRFLGVTSNVPDATLRIQRTTEAHLVIDHTTSESQSAATQKRSPLLAVLIAALVCAAVVIGLIWMFFKPPDSSARAKVKSLAILPFKPLGTDPADEYLGFGMTDTLITRLSGIERIVVRPTSAVQKYAADQDPIAAGREQRVDTVLEGTIQRAGEKVRVTVRLLNVADGAPVWAYKCDEYCADIFATQDSISQQVATALISKLTGEEKVRLNKRGTDNSKAYQAYLKGQFFWNKRNEEGLKRAVGFFEQAISEDPSYAQPYAGLSDTYTLLFGYGYVPRNDAIPKSRAAAQEAIKLDSSLAEAHTALAMISMNNDWDFVEAEREFRRALELNPNHPTTRHYYGEFMVLMGRFDEGLTELSRALELDPLSLIINTDLGANLYHAHRYDEAIEQLRKTLEMDPGFQRAHNWLTQAYWQKGMFQEAIDDIERWSYPQTILLSARANTYALAGKRREARSMLVSLQAMSKAGRAGSDMFIGPLIALGEYDAALGLLEKAYESRSTALTSLKVNPTYDPLRTDPRFVDLIKRIGFP